MEKILFASTFLPINMVGFLYGSVVTIAPYSESVANKRSFHEFGARLSTTYTPLEMCCKCLIEFPQCGALKNNIIFMHCSPLILK